MKTKTSELTMAPVTSLIAAGGGCADVAPAATDDVQPLPAPMVSADRDGAHVNIYELAPGELAVVATGDLPEGLEGKAPVEIYEAIAAVPAPVALREQQARIAAVRAQRAPGGEGAVDAAGAPERSTISNLTASQFQSSWCNPGAVDFDYCWTNRTNNYSTTFYNIKWIHSHLNAYSGTITHRMLYRGFAGSWNLINTDDTTGSSYVSTFTETPNGDYEVELTNASGDGYHLSLHGDV